MDLPLPNRPKPYLMAHRGNRVAYAENTLSAFQQAVIDDADIIETDIQITADGIFLCLHDATVDRTTNGSGLLQDLLYDQVRRLNAAAMRPDLAPESIPTISELAQVVPPPVAIAFELKSDQFLDPAICHRFSEELQKTGLQDRSVILSFSMDRLQTMQEADENLPIGWITMKRAWPQAGVQMFGPFWPLLFINPFLTWIAKIQGQLVCPLDPTPEPRILFYRLLGCDALLSDDPAKTARALGRSHEAPDD